MNNLQPEQRAQRLSNAIQKLMRGAITRDQYERAERDYAPNHLEAARALARTPTARAQQPRPVPAKR